MRGCRKKLANVSSFSKASLLIKMLWWAQWGGGDDMGGVGQLLDLFKL